MHNDVAMNLFYYVFSALCLIMILLWVVCNKNKNKFMFDQSGLENTFIVLWTREISLHKHNSCVLPRLIKHSLVLVILSDTPFKALWYSCALASPSTGATSPTHFLHRVFISTVPPTYCDITMGVYCDITTLLSCIISICTWKTTFCTLQM